MDIFKIIKKSTIINTIYTKSEIFNIKIASLDNIFMLLLLIIIKYNNKIYIYTYMLLFNTIKVNLNLIF